MNILKWYYIKVKIKGELRAEKNGLRAIKTIYNVLN